MSAPEHPTDSRPESSGSDVTITLLFPTLNEVGGLKLVLPQLDRSLFDDIVVIDGGSMDGTVEYARSQGLRVEPQERPGLAEGVFDAVNKLNTTHVIEFSPDGNCLVEKLPELVAMLKENYDLVTVSRYLPPAKSADDGFLTAIGNWGFSKIARYLGPFPVTDTLGMYRGFRCSILKNYDFEYYMLGPVLEPQVTAVCNVHKLRMAEIPGDEPIRVGGVSKNFIPYNGTMVLIMFIRMYILKLFKLKI